MCSVYEMLLKWSSFKKMRLKGPCIILILIKIIKTIK